MTTRARRMFDAKDITIACAVALLAQVGFVAAFSMPSPSLVEADISNDNARPLAVAITPILKLGSKTPNTLPPTWQRKRPTTTRSESALPSPQAARTSEAIPKTNVLDASAPHAANASSADLPALSAPQDAGAVATAASTEGSEQGASNGTETDPLKARAADMYRAQLAAWFTSHFAIRGKIPFDRLKTLHASAVVTVTADRKLGTFSIVKPSGDTTFDGEVRDTLARIQSGGSELPAPPPMYPEMLGTSIPVGFQCSVERLCE